MYIKTNILKFFLRNVGRPLGLLSLLTLLQVDCSHDTSETAIQNDLEKQDERSVSDSQYSAVELIAVPGDSLDIMTFFKQNAQPVYRWKNRYVMYGKDLDLQLLSDSLKSLFTNSEVKMFEGPLYDFQMSERCIETAMAREWEHVLLTANLVKDTILQNEYVKYHKTQYDEWPEVAKGFCNAEFQQVQVFKNGRQLLLIISIPKGKVLDDLNPKTIENNPKVIEWNSLMAKYQEGVEGTKENETWVFLDKMTTDELQLEQSK